jgi:uncharacterized protein
LVRQYRQYFNGIPMKEFELVIVKVTSFCNINCSYCYMFNAMDRTFTRVPRFMSQEISILLLNLIDEYMSTTESNRFHITLHGGEPSLWPKKTLIQFLKRVGDLNRAGRRLTVSMQTNGFRYDPSFFDILADHAVSVGVSLDHMFA